MTTAPPSHARIVIVGGGAVGCSIAYHLACAGERDVLLLERGTLTCGATWHAAGLVGQLRGNASLTRLMQYGAGLYRRIGDETGQDIGWHPVGSLRIASSAARWQELQRTAAVAKATGIELELISAAEAATKFPLMSTEGVVGAAWVPGDGYVDPYGLTQAYAKGARQGGQRIMEGVRVTGLATDGGRVVAVETDRGRIGCETAVNAAGLWARQVGELAGAALPVTVVEHQYMVTEKSARIPPCLPVLRDPDNRFYLKPEPGAVAVGGWERDTVAVNGDGRLPTDFGQQLFAGNFDRFEQVVLPAARRIPVLNEIGIRTLINGPIPISPDGEPAFGPCRGIENLFVACGFTSGIAASAGAGQAMARWILEGEPGIDVGPFDIRRFAPAAAEPACLNAAAIRAYAGYYALSGQPATADAG